ncbi:hypothetical protein [Ferruginibacter sp.]
MPITNSSQLTAAIAHLKTKADLQQEELREQVNDMYESIKPANLVKRLLNRHNDSLHFTDDLIDASIGAAAGYLSKKIIPGGKQNKFKKVVGNLVELSVAGIVNKNAGNIRSAGISLLERLIKPGKPQ